MTVVFHELASSRTHETGSSGSRELRYLAVAGDDDIEVRTEAQIQLPTSYDGLGNRRIRVEPIDVSSGLWEVTSTYRATEDPPPPEVGESSFSFEIGTTSSHITQSKGTVGGYAPAGTPTMPDFEGAIGVTPDGVDGCDILIPEARFSETHYLSDAFVTASYRRLLRTLTGKVNDASFRGHAAGEVLFLGARGGKRASDDVWEVTFSFATSDNATGLTVGSITGIAKDGWEYLWVLYEPAVDANRIVLQPAFAYVEEVYDSANFASLGIGT